jgi:macrolide-specific efflux system membrane fusion protein
MALTRRTIENYRELSLTYLPAREATLMFEVANVYIGAVYVEVGDEVREGDVVAELDRAFILTSIADAEREEAWAELSLSQLDERYSLRLEADAAAGRPIDESAYLAERDALLSRLKMLRENLERLRSEDARRVLRAPMDGTVTFALAFRPGDVSQRDTRVVTVSDVSSPVFAYTGEEIAYLRVGDTHVINVNQEPFDALVVNPAAYGIANAASDRAYLVIIDEYPQLPARVYASMRLTLAVAEDVLAVPYLALKQTEGRDFVFLLEDGVRVIRDVTVGLRGNNEAEIVSGLSEGDIIILE